MSTYLSHIIGNDHLVMSAERTLFWENESALIVADLHVGKSGHFRKAGIGVPQQVYKDDLHRLLSQILFFKAQRLIIVGDLTHSSANKEMELFSRWRKDFPSLEVQLVKGNHDILAEKWYNETEIKVNPGQLSMNGFSFVHDIVGDAARLIKDQYTFSGHVHPGVSIHGRGRQSLHFPCFYFTKKYCVLPAFSRFTGTYRVEAKPGERVFAIINNEMVAL